MEPYTIPYTADEATLPDRLPTIEDIETATDLISETTGRKVVGIGEHFVVKYGVHVDLLEGETMLLLATCTSVPVPQVYALFTHPERDVKYIVMERIHGSTLTAIRPTLDARSKEKVSLHLRSTLNDMRTLASPGGYCSAGRRGLSDDIFWTPNGSRSFTGPFQTEAELNDAIVLKYVDFGLSIYKAKFYARSFRKVYHHHDPVFTHGDLQRKNIMLRETSVTDVAKGLSLDSELELIIVDWETAGWYPSYWEYARAIFACGRWDDDWSDYLDEFLEPFHNEASWMYSLLREFWSKEIICLGRHQAGQGRWSWRLGADDAAEHRICERKFALIMISDEEDSFEYICLCYQRVSEEAISHQGSRWR